jgi:hypothetical protein
VLGKVQDEILRKLPVHGKKYLVLDNSGIPSTVYP